MRITYGILDNNIDVTDICKAQLVKKGYICIPSGDNNRARYFSDPLPGILKSVFLKSETNELIIVDDTKTIYIDIKTYSISEVAPSIIEAEEENINRKIKNIHSTLNIYYGSLSDEFPEQKMAVRCLTGTEKILEIGGNIGRNSLVIASILGNLSETNLVVLESHPEIFKQLNENRELNNMKFKTENSALSKRNLIQRGWDTIVSDEVLPDYTKVNTINFEELQTKYNIEFDTLVLDCEGAFYYILQDMPEILNNIQLIIMENDYHDASHKEYVDKILKEKGFNIDFVESGGWGPCYNNFFEVWKKTT